LIDHIHSTKTFFSNFHFETKTKQKKPRENKNMSRHQTLSQMFCFFGFMVLLVFVFVCLLIHMIAICALMLSYLIGPGKSDFDQSFIGCAVMFMHLKISDCNAFLFYL